MHPSIPLLLSALTLASAQDDRTLVSDFTQIIGVSNGGVGGTGMCQIQGTIDRGNQPVGFTVQRDCGRFQDNGSDYIEFDSAPDLKLLVSCDVKAGECGAFYDLRVETTDGYCNQGKTYRIDCPETDFKHKRSRGGVDARQEPPIGQQKQCYGDVLLVECFD